MRSTARGPHPTSVSGRHHQAWREPLQHRQRWRAQRPRLWTRRPQCSDEPLAGADEAAPSCVALCSVLKHIISLYKVQTLRSLCYSCIQRGLGAAVHNCRRRRGRSARLRASAQSSTRMSRRAASRGARWAQEWPRCGRKLGMQAGCWPTSTSTGARCVVHGGSTWWNPALS